MIRQGRSFAQAADSLAVSPRTLAAWRQCSSKPKSRGRPMHIADVITRSAVIDTLDDLGPSVGIPALRTIFPDVTRSELTGHIKTVQRQCYLDYQDSLCHLQWLVPGRVWTMDFTELLYPVDEAMRWCLAVRDLASNCQLLALAAYSASSETTFHALCMLFAAYGEPLVIKADNGSHFIAGNVHQLLADRPIAALHSPPYTPPRPAPTRG